MDNGNKGNTSVKREFGRLPIFMLESGLRGIVWRVFIMNDRD